MKESKIGIVGWKTSDNSFGATLPYMEFFSQFGNVEIISSTETEIRDIDLLVLPGGPDVDPSRYLGNNPLSYYMGKQCPFRERFDNVLLPKYINNRTPIFGICRGHQSLAVYFGGTLIQDMYHESNGHDRAELVHKVRVKFVNDIFNLENQRVNSMHHQVVDKVPSNAIVIAEHTEDNFIEGLAYIDYPAYTVQWHPEEIYDELSIKLISDLFNVEGITNVMGSVDSSEANMI